MKKIIIFAIVTICLIYLYPYRKGIELYWQQWSSVQRHYKCTEKRWELCRPFLSRSVAVQDPQAAAITELIFHDSYDNFQDIACLSEWALQYPENQYFLYELTCRIAARTYTDPTLVDVMADRLLQLNPQNGRYYALKALAALYEWDDRRVDKALDYLEKSFSCSDVSDPYDSYKTRVYALLGKEKPNIFISDGTPVHFSNDTYILREILSNILAYTQDLIVNSQSDRAMQIHDRLEKLAEKSVPQKIEFPWQQFWLQLRPEFGPYTKSPQCLELKWMNLSPQRASQDRRQVLAWSELMDKITFKKTSESVLSTPSRYESYRITMSKLSLASHCFELTIASVIVLGIFTLFGFGLKMRILPLSRQTVLAVFAFSLLYLAFCRWSDYKAIWFPGDWIGGGYGPVSETVENILESCKPYAPYGLCITPILVFGLIFLVKRYFRLNLFVRIIFWFLCFLFALSIWMSVTSLQEGTLIFDILVLVFAMPLIGLSAQIIKSRNYFGLFDRQEDAVQYRGRCVMVCGYMALFHFVVFSFVASALVKNTEEMIQRKTSENIYQPAYPPRYGIDPNDYAYLLARFNTSEKHTFNLSQWLPMVEPEDITKVLTMLRNCRANDPKYLEDPLGAPEPGLSSAGPINFLRDLPWAVQYCGKDVLPYVLPFFEEPNSEHMIIMRGWCKDVSVKDRITQLWRERFDQWKYIGHDDSVNKSEMNDSLDPNAFIYDPALEQLIPLEAVIGVCPFSESKAMILEYCKKSINHNKDCGIDGQVMKYFTRQQKGEILNAIVPLLKEKPSLAGYGLNLLEYNSDLNTTSKEWLWGRMVDYGNGQDKRYSLDDLRLQEKPYDYHISDELLTECMNNKNERLRAMGQHIWRKLNKPLDEQVLQQWAKDSNFVIRANAALLKPDEIGANDPVAFVRVIRNLALQK